MKPLATSQQVMTWLCMCPADESSSKKERMSHAAFTVTVYIMVFLGFVASIAFFVKYVSIDFDACLYTVCQASVEFSVLYLIIVALSRHRIAAIFTQLANIYTANETEDSFQFLVEANNKSEWLWQIYFKFGPLGLMLDELISMVLSIIYCFYEYRVFDADHLYKPYKILLPWNQTTPYGYFGEIIFSLFHGETYLLLNGSFLILFTSICWHHKAFLKIFHHTTLKLNQSDNEHNTNIIRELIRFHISVKDWFLDSAQVYSSFILIQLICNVVFMAAIIFQLDLRIKHIDLEFIVLLFAFLVGLSNLYVYCYFGQLATKSYEKMAESLYESKWCELTLDLQKKSLLMLVNMQQPVFYHGFGVSVLNLQTFIKLIRSVLTYYMLFKTLTE